MAGVRVVDDGVHHRDGGFAVDRLGRVPENADQITGDPQFEPVSFGVVYHLRDLMQNRLRRLGRSDGLGLALHWLYLSNNL